MNRTRYGLGIKKTEHAGAKKGTGAFYGRKADAKRASSRRRRHTNKSTINVELLQSLREPCGRSGQPPPGIQNVPVSVPQEII
jgi:hypothetical protein